MRARLRKLYSATAITALLALGACNSSVRPGNGLIGRLNNRGPVALSSNNPYLAANLLLAREMEKSSEFKGFIDHRGAPSAVEIVTESFTPLVVVMYYPESREYFRAEELEDTWLFSGPFPIPPAKMKTVATLTRNIDGEPDLKIDIQPQPVARAPQAEIPPAAPAVAQSAPQRAASGGAAPSPGAMKEASGVQQIISSAEKTPAELTPKGDLVHYVTYSGETLSIIARWYTEDRDNAARLARLNRLSNPNSLTLGDSIVVPGYLLKNRYRLTQQALRELQDLAAASQRR